MTAPAVRRLRRAVVLVLGLLVLVLPGAALLATPATAADDQDAHDDRFTRYALDAVVDDRGTAQVTLELEVDFGQEPNRGPVLTYLAKQPFPGAEPRNRVYRFTDVQVESPTGAATDVHVEEDGAWLEIRIGDEDRDDLTGPHRYVVTYQAEGLINSAAAFPALREDRLQLNVIGSGWTVPVDDVQVTVTGPTDVTHADCWAGRGDLTPTCDDAHAAGPTATFAQTDLDPGEQLTVRADFPVGTFGDVGPILQDRWTFGRAFALTPATGLVALLVAVAGIGHAVRRIRRDGRDEQFVGLTPGLAPPPGAEHRVGPRQDDVVAVQFTPPSGLRPGELGTLVDEQADPHDVTATIIDLAVRGYLRIDQVGAPDGTADEADEAPGQAGGTDDWRLVRLREPDDALIEYERILLEEIFDDRTEVTLSALRTTFASSMAKVQTALYEEVTAKGWFRRNPATARSRWAGAGVAILLGGIAVTAVLALVTTWALVGVAVVVVGLVVLSTYRAAPARTATGTAVLVQTEGFRRYLETAEAAQLRFEEGEDLFSRYLPFAVAFGLTERWAQLFADLAAQGRDLPEPTWYGGPAYAHGSFWLAASTFSTDLTGFTHVADSSLTAPTPGSSGTGGGNFAGGGVSGGGGGTW